MTLTDQDVWAMTHAARADLAIDLRGLTDEQWHTISLCADWDVEHVVAHLAAAAGIGPFRWFRSIVAAGFRPAVHNDRRLREQLGATPAETLARFEATVDNTIAPSKDLAAYLGEVLVHSQDIRVPLGLTREPDPWALMPVAEFFAARNFTVSSKAVAAGLQLRATDTTLDVGRGALVTGPTVALVMTMAGRTAYLDVLDGPGAETVRERLT